MASEWGKGDIPQLGLAAPPLPPQHSATELVAVPKPFPRWQQARCLRGHFGFIFLVNLISLISYG